MCFAVYCNFDSHSRYLYVLDGPIPCVGAYILKHKISLGLQKILK